MVPLGTPVPAFLLPDTNGKLVSNADFVGQPLLVAFICNHCPYVKHVADGLAQAAQEFQKMGVAVVGINSNDADAYPEDSPDAMRNEVTRRRYTFPYLFDASQEVARAFHAACTPDFFLFDRHHKLAYRGQMDDSRPSNGLPVTGATLRAAIHALDGKAAMPTQKASIGCNIKWR